MIRRQLEEVPHLIGDRSYDGRLKGWRRIVTHYGRCAYTFFSTICIGATVTFWL